MNNCSVESLQGQTFHSGPMKIKIEIQEIPSK